MLKLVKVDPLPPKFLRGVAKSLKVSKTHRHRLSKVRNRGRRGWGYINFRVKGQGCIDFWVGERVTQWVQVGASVE